MLDLLKFFTKAILPLMVFATVLSLTARYGRLSIERFFQPREQSVQRYVFEETKSYVYGVVQDLGKYYDEWIHADNDDKKIIENVIKQRFPNFDPDKIKSKQLRKWFIKVRGY